MKHCCTNVNRKTIFKRMCSDFTLYVNSVLFAFQGLQKQLQLQPRHSGMSIFQLDSIPCHNMEKAKRKPQRDFTINQKIGWKALLVSEEVSAENIIVRKTDAAEHLEEVYPNPSHCSSLKRFHCNGISIFSLILLSLKRFSFIWESRALNM